MKTQTIYDEENLNDHERKIICKLEDTNYMKTYLIKENDQFFVLEVFIENDEETKKIFINEYNERLKLTCVGYNCIFDYFKEILHEEDHFFFKTDFIIGITLDDIIKLCKTNGKRLKPYYKLKIILGLIKILYEFHKINYTYKYLHPLNILIDQDFCPHLKHQKIITLEEDDDSYLNEFLPSESFDPGLSSKFDNFNESSDVFMFGGILYFIISGNYPSPDDNHTSFFDSSEISEDEYPFYQIVTNYCCNDEREKRSKAETIGGFLIQAISRYIKDEEKQQKLFSYLYDIELTKYRKEYYRGTQHNIDKAIRNGFYPFIDDKEKQKQNNTNIIDIIIRNHLHNEDVMDLDKAKKRFLSKYAENKPQ